MRAGPGRACVSKGTVERSVIEVSVMTSPALYERVRPHEGDTIRRTCTHITYRYI